MSSIDVAASAAYESWRLAAHEVGTRPAFRDGYAAGLDRGQADLAAARAEVGRLREAMRYATDLWADGKDPFYILAGIEEAGAERPAPPAQI